MEEIKSTMETMFVEGMTTFAKVAEESINAVITSKMAQYKPTNANAASSTEHEKLAKQLKKEISALQKNLRGNSCGTIPGDGGSGGSKPRAQPGKYAYCGKVHRGFKKEGGPPKCRKRPELRHQASETWKWYHPLLVDVTVNEGWGG